MAWHSSSVNPVNRLNLPEAMLASMRTGAGAGAAEHIAQTLLADLTRLGRPCCVALDGYKGVDFGPIVRELQEHLTAAGVAVTTLDVNRVYQSPEQLRTLLAPWLTEDPSFGRVFPGELVDLTDPEQVARWVGLLTDARGSEGGREVIICSGPGAALPAWRHLMDRVAYFDVTREQLIARGERGEVMALGSGGGPASHWKRDYYVEYPLLNRHKKRVLQDVDWYVAPGAGGHLALLPRGLYSALMEQLAGQPVVFKVFYMPGTFGGTSFGELFHVPGLPNTSWDYEISVGDSHMLVDAGDGRILEIPFYNLLYAEPLRLLGAYSSQSYPDHFPLAVYMQDGYFPPGSDAGFKRTHMPHHLHPDTAYAHEHFGEPLGRYETYYIVRADPGAVTMHGFHDDADIDAYVAEVKASAQTGEEFDWRRYIYEHPSRTGELHQLPPGTVHGTGGRQIILEIDTNPSRESTEYSFYLYDYCRPTFNYAANDLSGPPARLQLNHGLASLRRNRKKTFMEQYLRPAPVCVRSGSGWREMSFPMYFNMPYQVNRLEFSTRIEDDTAGFFHCLALTSGHHVRVVSLTDPSRSFTLGYCQNIVVPASFGPYVCENLSGGECEVVKAFLLPGTREVPAEFDW